MAFNPMHTFSSHINVCPWCQRIMRHQIADPFPKLLKTQPINTSKQRVPTRPSRPVNIPTNTPAIAMAQPVRQGKTGVPAAAALRHAGNIAVGQPVTLVPSGKIPSASPIASSAPLFGVALPSVNRGHHK